MFEKIVVEGLAGLRLDQFLADNFKQISRSYLQKLCSENLVSVNGKAQKSGYKLKLGDIVKADIDIDLLGKVPDISLPIIYEDNNVLVISKPAGILSHALSKFHEEPSVASFLRQSVKGDDENLRMGIVHRLDRPTSGVMICAKNPETSKFLQTQFQKVQVKKNYRAIAEGFINPDEALIDVPLERNPKRPATWRAGPNGKEATTAYKVIKRFEKANKKYTYVDLFPKTGRTHQLRVHLAHLGNPIVGDYVYGKETKNRLMLHAHSLTIDVEPGKSMTFTAPVPFEFDEFMKSKKKQHAIK